MTIDEAIVNKIKASTSIVANLASVDAIYPTYTRESDRQYPQIVYMVQTPIITETNTGALSSIQNAVIIHCIGNTDTESAELAYSVIHGLHSQSGIWSGITVQAMFFDDDGMSVIQIMEPETETVLNFDRECSFTITWNLPQS